HRHSRALGDPGRLLGQIARLVVEDAEVGRLRPGPAVAAALEMTDRDRCGFGILRGSSAGRAAAAPLLDLGQEILAVLQPWCQVERLPNLAFQVVPGGAAHGRVVDLLDDPAVGAVGPAVAAGGRALGVGLVGLLEEKGGFAVVLASELLLGSG